MSEANKRAEVIKDRGLFLLYIHKITNVERFLNIFGYVYNSFEILNRDFSTTDPEIISYYKIGYVLDKYKYIVTTPLHVYARYGLLDVFKLLLQHGADINRLDMFGSTPLLITNYSGIYEYIINNCDVDLNHADTFGNNLFELVLSNKNYEYTRLIISRGVDPRKQRTRINTLIQWHILYPETVELLLEYAKPEDLNLIHLDVNQYVADNRFMGSVAIEPIKKSVELIAARLRE